MGPRPRAGPMDMAAAAEEEDWDLAALAKHPAGAGGAVAVEAMEGAS